jgi:transposase
MASHQEILPDAIWEKVSPFLPQPQRRKRGGRPPAENRAVLGGILWILRTGARWKDIPKEFASGSTCWRRLKAWEEEGLWLKIWREYLAKLDEKQQLAWSECFMDGSFAPAKKGAMESARPRREREQSGWWWSTAREFLWGTTWTLRPRRKSR